ncbi:MAG: bifunctional 5,10-methylenetetrahydrofolate dehydrogenase/5,10-methenyltetrahydrofolate cyclohydrolase [Puniceicoccales bacterium]|jgi:methylenetetrahydrofolate dehydrogenase (NADP+)/methenyltetrahydrofolate cyclohydrolase|nr:bifunctional 5,10-methylenetetrahydrofolate dehydrogenase/5,10-methenyltetrahydrofolate cyclohydrolase [Puniceicoccales bacterium]
MVGTFMNLTFPQILDGQRIGEEMLVALRDKAESFLVRTGRKPKLALLRIGENPASALYMRRKCAVAEKIGIECTASVFPIGTPLESVEEKISQWNNSPSVDAIMVQAPLPSAEYQRSVFNAIDPKKDVDGFHPVNVGKLACEDSSGFVPCTPKGILRLLHAHDIPLAGRHVVIIGRSSIVGRPLGLLLQSRTVNATVTICHSRSQNLASITRAADILVVAAGRAKLVTADMVKNGIVVVDVGQNRDESGLLCGDVDFRSVAPRCMYITPVPGGVGPMTVAMLMENVIQACEHE